MVLKGGRDGQLCSVKTTGTRNTEQSSNPNPLKQQLVSMHRNNGRLHKVHSNTSLLKQQRKTERLVLTKTSLKDRLTYWFLHSPRIGQGAYCSSVSQSSKQKRILFQSHKLRMMKNVQHLLHRAVKIASQTVLFLLKYKMSLIQHFKRLLLLNQCLREKILNHFGLSCIRAQKSTACYFYQWHSFSISFSPTQSFLTD